MGQEKTGDHKRCELVHLRVVDCVYITFPYDATLLLLLLSFRGTFQTLFRTEESVSALGTCKCAQEDLKGQAVVLVGDSKGL